MKHRDHKPLWQNILSWVLRCFSSIVLGQTLFFKFSGATESVALFTKLGMEPYGRIGTGVAELIACLLLLLPKTVSLGAFFAVGLMSGAIYFHLTVLGITSGNDKGFLFILACLVWVSSANVLLLERKQWLAWLGKK
jgi:uncharacterized membrane protein YphA (DoxX/SURF4 family)